MKTIQIKNQKINVHQYHTLIVGAGAAGMNCAVHLYEFMTQKGVEKAEKKIGVITAGLGLGASRMSGSDKQTYYKLGTSPAVADSAEDFAKSITANGCAHHDLALVEAVGSLREFYHLVQAGVPFPHDAQGSYIGYKTDHDPYQRATSAGPKTSKFMSECLQRQVERYKIAIHDNQEVARLITVGKDRAKNPSGNTDSPHPSPLPKGEGTDISLPTAGAVPGEGTRNKRIAAVVTVDRSRIGLDDYAINVFACENLVLAAGGPGELYETTVYPQGQFGIHGLAFEAGMAAENLTESQFGLASIKYRWNVSGSYMQVIPRIYSTDADGSNEREFLAEVFPSMREMASKIFMKGYQWPFDPQRIENLQSSLIDVLVFNETRQGRRVFMDFLHNPAGRMPSSSSQTENMGKMPVPPEMGAFDLEDLELEARMYLLYTGATQQRPIDRLMKMNPLAIDIYAEHGIDLWKEPLEIAVCAQHNNGGFAVNKWWESNIPHTFVIGEMAGTHGIKRPGGSALNAGQTGGLRAAEYIANVYTPGKRAAGVRSKVLEEKLGAFVDEMEAMFNCGAGIVGATVKLSPQQCALAGEEVMGEIRRRMTASAGHIRRLEDARAALAKAVELCRQIGQRGLAAQSAQEAVAAIRARHLALTSVVYLKAIATLLEQGGGSRGSHLVLSEDGVEIHPSVIDQSTGRPLRFKKENVELRKEILQVQFDPENKDLFACRNVAPRLAGKPPAAFEPAWEDFREGKIYQQ
ncbi:MAG: FAD-binding protein [Thermoguttaceae bacterium]|jgi:succinate dehydrogenase/fumarate reductase flavoprotein subunit